jgi:hypothetical protein
MPYPDSVMPEKDDEPTQTTPGGDERKALDLPGEGGTEIPVPKRDDVMGALRKVAEEGDSEESAT